jgi:hypothetical protein
VPRAFGALGVQLPAQLILGRGLLLEPLGAAEPVEHLARRQRLDFARTPERLPVRVERLTTPVQGVECGVEVGERVCLRLQGGLSRGLLMDTLTLAPQPVGEGVGVGHRPLERLGQARLGCIVGGFGLDIAAVQPLASDQLPAAFAVVARLSEIGFTGHRAGQLERAQRLFEPAALSGGFGALFDEPSLLLIQRLGVGGEAAQGLFSGQGRALQTGEIAVPESERGQLARAAFDVKMQARFGVGDRAIEIAGPPRGLYGAFQTVQIARFGGAFRLGGAHLGQGLLGVGEVRGRGGDGLLHGFAVSAEFGGLTAAVEQRTQRFGLSERQSGTDRGQTLTGEFALGIGGGDQIGTILSGLAMAAEPLAERVDGLALGRQGVRQGFGAGFLAQFAETGEGGVPALAQ